MIRKSGNRFSGKIMLKQKDNGAYFLLLNGAAANRRQPFSRRIKLMAAEQDIPSFRESRDSGFALPRALE
jgi:hypothetical protein